MEPKKYSHASLRTMCNDDVKSVLPWHDLKDDGLWLSKPGPLVVGNDRETMEWHPRTNGNMPALPVPFSAYELAAFFLAGGGVHLRDEFEDYESLDESALKELGTNAVDERAALREAHRLYLEASIRFGRTDQGTREAADWLLNHAFEESMATAEEQRKQEHEPADIHTAPVTEGTASRAVEPSESNTVEPDAKLEWSLKSISRAPGYRWPLHQVMRAECIAGRPIPKPRDVLAIWKLSPPPDVQVMPDGVKYNDGTGSPKEANLKAIQQAIKNLVKR